jgi:dihydroanticapsin dehydrogenase
MLFAKEGAKVVVAGIGDGAGIETVALIRKEGGEALLLNADVANNNDVKEVIEATVKAFGKLDILANSEVLFAPKPLPVAVEDWQSPLVVNLLGTALMSRHAAEAMKLRRRGAIVNIVTICGLVTSPPPSAFNATQAALVQMTQDLAVDLAAHNIRVNCVCHGGARSVIHEEPIWRTAETGEESLESESPKHLLNQKGKPSEVANAILLLASDESSSITGANLVVGGGYYDTVKSSFQTHLASRVASFS